MMKKMMWIVAIIPLIVTCVVLQFMPDVIPMHHDLQGNTDRWGNKAESLIFPIPQCNHQYESNIITNEVMLYELFDE